MADKTSYVPDWLEKRSLLSPDKVAIINADTKEKITYAQWNKSTNQTAYYLQSLGIGKGDRVAILAGNCMEYLETWFACNKLGSIMQSLNWRLTPVELKGIIDDASPQVLIYSGDFSELAASLQKNTSCVNHWLAIDKKVAPTDKNFSDKNKFPAKPFPKVEISQDDPWVICYTGGTTGLPKGAMLTFRAINTNAINTVMSWELDSSDIAILNAPLFHTGGLNVFTAPLVQAGGTSILCKSFSVEQTFDLINNWNVTLFFGVPTMFITMQQHKDWNKVDFSRCKLVINGGAPAPLDVFEKFWARGIDFKTGYGLTEAGPNTFWLPKADVRRKPGYVGIPLFHVDVKLVDEAGKEVGPNEVGEIIIRGDHVCSGYWNNPEATSKTIVDGWLHTGDLGMKDEEGYFKIVDRLKDMIISGGENIYPAEIESAIFSCEGVAEVTVIGVPDPKWGEVGCAIIVASDPQLTEKKIKEHCLERLAKYKIPKFFKFVKEIPKTGAGKIDKKVVKASIKID
ncbi:MAG TPA: long-chain fatty acid--CoA ligase [Smithellaceae bacterium]|nr:long-chain fatty acid--CoA ligase [Smithellaceae bacterium]